MNFCFTRYGIQLAKRDFRAWGLLSIVVLIAVFLFMMSMWWNHLTILTIGEKNFYFRYARFSFSLQIPSYFQFLSSPYHFNPLPPQNRRKKKWNKHDCGNANIILHTSLTKYDLTLLHLDMAFWSMLLHDGIYTNPPSMQYEENLHAYLPIIRANYPRCEFQIMGCHCF